MSIARIYTTKKVQKNWTCGKCGTAIVKGQDGRISFAVGFRGREQTRCTKPECRPTASELESSAVATVYAAQESAGLDSIESGEDFEAARDAVADACDEVSDEYESNEMFDINEDLQQRAETLRSAGDELRNWEPESEPDEDDAEYQEQECSVCEGTGQEDDNGCTECGGTGLVDPEEDFEAAHDEWLEATRTSLQSAIDEMELP